MHVFKSLLKFFQILSNLQLPFVLMLFFKKDQLKISISQ